MSKTDKGGRILQDKKLPHSHGESQPIEPFRQDLEKDEQFRTVSEIFKQLSDPSRLRIFWLLCHMEECVTDIAALMGMSSPAVSYHLSSLAESGLIVSRRDGKETLYKASEGEESRLLHQFVEQAMALPCPKKAVNYQAPPEDLVRQIHDYLLEHLSEHITIQSLSEKFLINPTSLKATYKKVYGDSLANHIKTYRLDRAAQLLAESDARIAEISALVGYESQSRFAAAFRERFGSTPGEYRLRSRSVITTERLLLRRIAADDWRAIRAIWASVAKTEYAKYDKPKPLDDEGAARRIAKWAEYADSSEHMFYAVCLQETVIGFVALHQRDGECEIGYSFHTDYHRQGYARESISALIDAMRQQGVERILAGTALENTPSVSLLLSLGFRQIAVEKVSFYRNENGNPIYFDGGVFELEL